MVTVSLQDLPFKSSHYSPFPLEKHTTGLPLALSEGYKILHQDLLFSCLMEVEKTETRRRMGKKNTLQSSLLPSQKIETGA